MSELSFNQVPGFCIYAAFPLPLNTYSTLAFKVFFVLTNIKEQEQASQPIKEE
jgi:hypothetical protein